MRRWPWERQALAQTVVHACTVVSEHGASAMTAGEIPVLRMLVARVEGHLWVFRITLADPTGGAVLELLR